MTAPQAEIIRISREYAEACADCEHLRTSEAYPHTEWKAAWERRQRLLSEWVATAMRLSSRPTLPPELRLEGAAIVWAATGARA